MTSLSNNVQKTDVGNKYIGGRYISSRLSGSVTILQAVRTSRLQKSVSTQQNRTVYGLVVLGFFYSFIWAFIFH